MPPKSYIMPANEMLGADIATNLAHFLAANGKSVVSFTSFHMAANDQRKLFGRFLGKGTIVIDGEREELRHVRKVCFGTDWDTTDCIRWSAL